MEVAGLGQLGSAHHIKLSHSQAKYIPVAILGTPLPSLAAMSLSLAASASLLLPLCAAPSSICDRLTLGGPLTMRGYTTVFPFCSPPHPAPQLPEVPHCHNCI